jgi:peptidoglycan hydrolase CwlO-like protein
MAAEAKSAGHTGYGVFLSLEEGWIEKSAKSAQRPAISGRIPSGAAVSSVRRLKTLLTRFVLEDQTMIKKTLVAAGALALLSVLFFGRDAASYLYTSFGWIKDSVKSQVPVEFEIERARRMVKNLVHDIPRNMHVIAQEEVEIERLDKEIAKTESTMAREKTEIMKLKGDLATAQPVYHYGNRSYPIQQVKIDLANRFERYKTHDATLASLRDMLAVRRTSLDAARQKLDKMLVAKRDLEVQVENLDAKYKVIQVAQTTSEFNIDDSQLGRVKDLIAEVRTRLNVAERLVNSQTDINGEIPLSEPASDNIVDQVTEYFETDQAPATAAADAQANAAK